MEKPGRVSDSGDGRAAAAVRAGFLACLGLTLANCAQQPTRTAGGYSGQERREIGAFSHSRYGRASDRVVADGDPVPKGGGRDLVGRPYTIAGRRYVPYEKRAGHTEVGGASWYGVAFHGRRTANGEVFDRHSISAAHKTMPLPSYARVSNLVNGRSIIVRVNDRGPYHGGRIIDVSQRVADLLDFRASGTGRVKVEYMGRASVAGSDDRKLMATLRTDGTGAPVPDGGQSRIMVASVDDSGGQSYAPAAPGFGLFSSAPAVAVRSAPPVEAPAPVVAATPRPAPVVVASAAPPGPPVALPLPPERPFDLATIPNAGTPVMSAVPGLLPAASVQTAAARRPATASVAQLFYAAPSAPAARFVRSDPWANLKAQTFRPLRETGDPR
jgi:rare lipoprotein A